MRYVNRLEAGEPVTSERGEGRSVIILNRIVLSSCIRCSLSVGCPGCPVPGLCHASNRPIVGEPLAYAPGWATRCPTPHCKQEVYAGLRGGLDPTQAGTG